MLDSQLLKQIVGSILRKRIPSSALHRFTIEVGEDHDGVPSIFVTAYFKAASRKLSSFKLLDGANEVREELRSRGEFRLPYIRYVAGDTRSEIAA